MGLLYTPRFVGDTRRLPDAFNLLRLKRQFTPP